MVIISGTIYNITIYINFGGFIFMRDKLYLGVDIGKQTNSISFYFQRKEVLKRKYFDNNIWIYRYKECSR